MDLDFGTYANIKAAVNCSSGQLRFLEVNKKKLTNPYSPANSLISFIQVIIDAVKSRHKKGITQTMTELL